MFVSSSKWSLYPAVKFKLKFGSITSFTPLKIEPFIQLHFNWFFPLDFFNEVLVKFRWSDLWCQYGEKHHSLLENDFPWNLQTLFLLNFVFTVKSGETILPFVKAIDVILIPMTSMTSETPGGNSKLRNR